MIRLGASRPTGRRIAVTAAMLVADLPSGAGDYAMTQVGDGLRLPGRRKRSQKTREEFEAS
jgi:hypothetical protein